MNCINSGERVEFGDKYPEKDWEPVVCPHCGTKVKPVAAYPQSKSLLLPNHPYPTPSSAGGGHERLMDKSLVTVVPHLGNTFKASIGSFEKDGFEMVAFGDTRSKALYALKSRLEDAAFTVGSVIGDRLREAAKGA